MYCPGDASVRLESVKISKNKCRLTTDTTYANVSFSKLKNTFLMRPFKTNLANRNYLNN